MIFVDPILQSYLSLREATKKKTGKKGHNSWELWGGGQQILVCEPQKSAFLELIFQKKTML